MEGGVHREGGEGRGGKRGRGGIHREGRGGRRGRNGREEGWKEGEEWEGGGVERKEGLMEGRGGELNQRGNILYLILSSISAAVYVPIKGQVSVVGNGQG